MPLNCQLCLSAHILPVFTSDFLYPSLIHICLKSLSLPLTHPAHLNNPLTVFIYLFFSVSFPLCLSLSFLYVPFISPCCLSLPFCRPALLVYLFYLCSFISFHHFPLIYFVTAAFLFTLFFLSLLNPSRSIFHPSLLCLSQFLH